MTDAALATLTAVEEALEANDFEQAIDVLAASRSALRGDPATEFRALLDESWGLMSTGRVEDALVKLERARLLAESEGFGDADRSEVLYRLGCCRLKLGAVANAVQLFTVALDLCERAPGAPDRLRVDILRWRTRCYRRQRDWDGARADAEAAVELAEPLGDPRRLADAYLQASQVAERTGQLLVARFWIEQSADLFRAAGDRLNAGKALNNLGGILFLLGDPDAAGTRLKEAFAIALELGDDVDAGYAVSSTAQVLLRGGDARGAEENARYALDLLGARTDHANEIGSAQLVLGRALMEQGRLEEAAAALRRADDCFRQMDSIGHRAAAWLAQGDLARREGSIEDAADAYRRAAEALQDVRF
jgi:tetratricopeptide (TPR) repeat protein